MYISCFTLGIYSFHPFLELGKNLLHMGHNVKFPNIILSPCRYFIHSLHQPRASSLSQPLSLASSRNFCSGCGSSILVCRWAPTPAAAGVVHGVAVVTLHSPVLHLSCTGLSQGGHSSWLIVAAQTLGRTERESQPLSSYQRKKKISKVSVFWDADSTGAAWVVSDGGSEAKSQQIHLLSPAISQRNWRQFVSSWWEKNLEALCKDAPKGGSRGVRCDRGPQNFWRDKRRNNGVRQTCYLDMQSIVTCFPGKEPYKKLCGVRQRSWLIGVYKIWK